MLDEESDNPAFHVDAIEINRLLVDYCIDNIRKTNNENDYSDIDDYFIQHLGYHIYQLSSSYWDRIGKY